MGANVGNSLVYNPRVLTRRELLSGVIATSAAASIARLAFAEDTAALRINAARLQQSLEGLSVFGRTTAEVSPCARQLTRPAGDKPTLGDANVQASE